MWELTGSLTSTIWSLCACKPAFPFTFTGVKPLFEVRVGNEMRIHKRKWHVVPGMEGVLYIILDLICFVLRNNNIMQYRIYSFLHSQNTANKIKWEQKMYIPKSPCSLYKPRNQICVYFTYQFRKFNGSQNG